METLQSFGQNKDIDALVHLCKSGELPVDPVHDQYSAMRCRCLKSFILSLMKDVGGILSALTVMTLMTYTISEWD